MAEAASSLEIKVQITESDMEAAHQLVQLSDEENGSEKRNRSCEDEEVDQRMSDMSVAKKIREIFGEDDVVQPKKQRRYRSLLNIYMATSPVVSMLQR